MQSIECIIRVDIASGRVLENNLRAFWETQTRRNDLPNPAWHRKLAMPSCTNMQVHDELLAERVKKFNSTRRRRTKNAWTDTEVHQLAVLTGIQKQKPYQAAARLTRSPRACQQMFKAMQKAGVV